MGNRVLSGVHKEMEAYADALIFDSIRHITNRLDKLDVLTPWKEKHRHEREVLTAHGAPVDAAVRRGMFNRDYNSRQTHLNSYDGPTRPIRDQSWDPDMSFGNTPAFLSPQMADAAGVDRLD